MVIPSDSNKRGLNSFVFNTNKTCANTKVYRGVQPKVFTETGINSVQVSPTCNSTKGLESIRTVIRSKANAKVILGKTAESVNKYFLRILRVIDELDFSRQLSSYRIDSLAAVEVRNFLKVELSAKLTTLEIINAISLLFICELIIEEVLRLA